MGLPLYFQYNKEEQVRRGCVTVYAATLDSGCAIPRVTSAARVKGPTKANFAKFFDIFVPLLWLINVSPHSLFNYDKMDLTVIQHKVCKVISLKGKQRVSLSSADRDSLATIVTCMNATVTYVPHLLVFPRRNMKAELLESAPPGSVAACHKAGWIQKQSFMQWFKHFVRFVKLSKNDPVTDTGWSLFSFKE